MTRKELAGVLRRLASKIESEEISAVYLSVWAPNHETAFASMSVGFDENSIVSLMARTHVETDPDKIVIFKSEEEQ